jgi:hypothetical protein
MKGKKPRLYNLKQYFDALTCPFKNKADELDKAYGGFLTSNAKVQVRLRMKITIG